MSDPIGAALALWGMEGAHCSFVAGRETRVYRVRAATGDFALRLCRPGLRRAAELVSELHWLDAMHRAGLHVPRPKRSQSGALIEEEGKPGVDMVGWLSGQPLGRSRVPLAFDGDRGAVFHRLGRKMARLHLACDGWVLPGGFVRWRRDVEGPVGAGPLWGRFWETPTLDAPTRALFEAFRDRARDGLAKQEATLDSGLIHTDLVRDNVRIDGDAIRLLDFDDGGFGFRLFDIAIALIKNRAETGYDTLKAALIAVDRALRPLDTGLLDLFVRLRAARYVGWSVPRMGEDAAVARTRGFVAETRALCGAWPGQPNPA